MDEEQNKLPAPESEAETDQDETTSLLASGANGGNRAGAMALLFIIIVVCGAVHFHFSNGGAGSFISRLDSDLLTHAELALASNKAGSRLAVVPSWPLRIYSSLRRDISLYTAIAALAAIVWGLSVRARARRDAYLVHQKLGREIAVLRARLDSIDNSSVNPDTDQQKLNIPPATPEKGRE